MTDGGRTLGQTLRAARETKGWDVARAERETRIRSRYLTALEEGDYADLPSQVYAQGFVRNYATYLGLEPEACLDLYHREATPAVPTRPAVAPPKPMVVEKRDALITRGRLAAAALVILVVAFIAYLAFQFLTFAGTPGLTVTDPPTDVPAYAGTSYLLRGTTVPNAAITVDGLRENPSTIASATGEFTLRVELVPGSNVVTVVATDPITERTSSPVVRTITVTLPVETPAPSGSPGAAGPIPTTQ
jgi:cytoskeletal protein RodZ